MNIPLIVLLVINYWYLIHFTYLYCSYTKNRIKYLGTSSKSLIEGTVGLTSTKDLLDILVRQNITYPLNSQPNSITSEGRQDALAVVLLQPM